MHVFHVKVDLDSSVHVASSHLIKIFLQSYNSRQLITNELPANILYSLFAKYDLSYSLRYNEISKIENKHKY